VARRIAQRRAYVRRILDLRRRHIRVCFRGGNGKRVCRVPRPPVCLKRSDGRTVCRARRR
jgi:hypothetical protein